MGAAGANLETGPVHAATTGRLRDAGRRVELDIRQRTTRAEGGGGRSMDHPSANTDARTPSSLGLLAEPSTRDSHAEDNSSSCLTADWAMDGFVFHGPSFDCRSL